VERVETERLLRSLDRRVSAVEQILPTVATRADLEAAIAPLATRAELEAAIAPLATRAELEAAIAPLASKAEMREEGERTRRHFDVVAESLRQDIRLIAEVQAASDMKIDALAFELRRGLANHERRLTRLEARAKPR